MKFLTSSFVLSFLVSFFASAAQNLTSPTVESEVTRKLEEAIRSEIKGKTGAEDSEIRVQVSALQLRPVVIVKDWREVQIFGVGLEKEGLEGIFSLPVQVISKEGRFLSSNAYGTVEVVAPVFVAAGEIRANEVIGESDIRRQIMPWKFLHPGFVPLTKDQIVGRRSRVRLNSGAALFSQVLDEPLAVRVGETVSLTLQSGPGVLIRSRAVAKSNGKIGERIHVLNPQTKKQVEALVTADKEVELSL